MEKGRSGWRGGRCSVGNYADGMLYLAIVLLPVFSGDSMDVIIENRCCKCENCSSDMIYCRVKIKHIEADADNCALEQLDLFMAQWSIPPDQREWFIAWANLRSSNVLAWLFETMLQIVDADSLESAKHIAARTMKTCGVKGKP